MRAGIRQTPDDVGCQECAGLMEHGDSIWVREGAHHVIHDFAKGELRKYLAPLLVALENTDAATEVHMAALRAVEMLEKGG